MTCAGDLLHALLVADMLLVEARCKTARDREEEKDKTAVQLTTNQSMNYTTSLSSELQSRTL